ncbi:hypothetical protein AAG747_04930 [Rapidithrix thailandica]|uniref:Uncharacterized protein n=1 Tax=Rapidithrix thailandica TaxID=413964 RepID=A0AAW9RVZ5_9BACT
MNEFVPDFSTLNFLSNPLKAYHILPEKRKLICWTSLQAMSDGNQILLERTVRQLQVNLLVKVTQLQNATKAHDWDSVYRLAKALKSSLDIVDANIVQNLFDIIVQRAFLKAKVDSIPRLVQMCTTLCYTVLHELEQSEPS